METLRLAVGPEKPEQQVEVIHEDPQDDGENKETEEEREKNAIVLFIQAWSDDSL